MTTTEIKARSRAPRASRTKPDDSPESDLQHYTRTEAARLLRISPRLLLDLIANGEIDCTFFGGGYKFTAAHIRAYSAKGEIKAGPRGRKAA